MKVAICYFGLPRFLTKQIDAKTSFFAGLNISYYAHFWSDNPEETEQMACESIPFRRIKVENQLNFSNFFPSPVELARHNSRWGAAYTTQQLISPLVSMNRSFATLDDTFDLVFITRTDVVHLGSSLVDHITRSRASKFYCSRVRGSQWEMPSHNPILDFKFFGGDQNSMAYMARLIHYVHYYIYVLGLAPNHHYLLGYHARNLGLEFSFIGSNHFINQHDAEFGNFGWYFQREVGLSVT